MRRIHSPVGFTSTYSLCTDLKSSLVIPTISGKYGQASIHSNTKHLQRVYICMRILLRLLSLCLSPLCRHVELLYTKFMRDPQFYVGYNWLSDYISGKCCLFLCNFTRIMSFRFCHFHSYNLATSTAAHLRDKLATNILLILL